MAAAQKVACVEIGEIPIGLFTSDESFLAQLCDRYQGFLSSARPQFGLQFDLAAFQPGSNPDNDVSVRRAGAEWHIERGDLQARWDPLTGQGIVRQNANPYSLDAVLRILHSLILAPRGGFLLHAASAICDDRAFVFSGVSGAGKTTITRLAPPDATVLSDEISYLRPTLAEHPSNTTTLAGSAPSAYAAFGTPFAGEFAKAGENCTAPLAALFFLEQGPENRIDELSSTEAVRRLMRNILFFAEDRLLVETLFATACNFVSRVPIRRLTFYPDSRVWDDIRNFASNPQRAYQMPEKSHA